MPKTVALFVDTLEFGGAEQALLQLLTGLDRGRFRPVLMMHEAAALKPLHDAAAEIGAEVRIVPRLQGRACAAPRLRQGLDAITGLGPFVRALRAIRPDVFHAHQNWPMACKYALIGAGIARIPRVLTSVQLFPDLATPRWSAWQHRTVSRAVHAHIAVSQAVARSLRDVLGVPADRIAVVPNAARLPGTGPAPLPRSDLLAPGTRWLALTPARLSAEKGHKYLLSAAAGLPDVTFLLAGDGPERHSLNCQARVLGVDSRVRFLGYRNDLDRIMAACDFVVLPSLHEGLPLSVLEAMAASKPVVATAVGGTGEAVVDGQTGILVPPRDPSALSTAVRALTSNGRRAEEFGTKGLERVRSNFSVEKMVRSISELYVQA